MLKEPSLMLRQDENPIRVVVVGDRPNVREQISHILRQGGFEPLQAGASTEAVAFIDEGVPGVVLLDSKLPSPDGTVSLRQLVRQSIMKVEEAILRETLKFTGGNKAKAARFLQIDYKTMHTKAKEYGLQPQKVTDLPEPEPG
jgi:DNA-binding NtrC family response regulator